MEYFFTDKTIGKNIAKLQQKVGNKKLLFMKQTHSDIVEIVDKNWITKECDAMISADRDVALVVVVADCNPVIIEDNNKQIVAVVHAGRVGSYKGIVAKTILKMQKEFESSLKDLYVVFGPSIKKCCYEVGDEVLNERLHSGALAKDFTTCKEGKYYLDLISLNLYELDKLGVKNIKIDSTCTCCSSDYFSYRRDKTDKRFCGVAHL
ncbi:peptidoglycan editing factor PgeF [Sulfurospirillum sp. 1307]